MTKINFTHAVADNDGTAILHFTTRMNEDALTEAGESVWNYSQVCTGWNFNEDTGHGYFNVDMSLAGTADDHDTETYLSIIQDGCDDIAERFDTEFTGPINYDAVACLQENINSATQELAKKRKYTPERQDLVLKSQWSKRISEAYSNIWETKNFVKNLEQGKLGGVKEDVVPRMIEAKMIRIDRQYQNIEEWQYLIKTRTPEYYAKDHYEGIADLEQAIDEMTSKMDAMKQAA